MKRRIGIIAPMVVGCVLSISLGIAAQQSPTKPPPQSPATPAGPPLTPVPAVPAVPSVPPVPKIDPLADVIFPPDLIMRNARMLELTNEQKTFMREEIQKTSTRFNDLQWQLQDAMELLHKNLESSSVNEEQALSQLDKVLDIERQIKHLHVGMGIRIKNRLTPEQQGRLQNAKRWHRAPTQMPGE